MGKIEDGKLLYHLTKLSNLDSILFLNITKECKELIGMRWKKVQQNRNI